MLGIGVFFTLPKLMVYMCHDYQEVGMDNLQQREKNINAMNLAGSFKILSKPYGEMRQWFPKAKRKI